MMSDMPERIYVDPHSPELDWCYAPLDEMFTEYIRADKYAELEAKHRRLVSSVREQNKRLVGQCHEVFLNLVTARNSGMNEEELQDCIDQLGEALKEKDDAV